MGAPKASREAHAGVLMENRMVASLERYCLLNKNRSLHIALEEKDFIWSREDVNEFELMYRNGTSLNEIAEYFDKQPVEVLLLALDRIEAGTIQIREGWRIT